MIVWAKAGLSRQAAGAGLSSSSASRLVSRRKARNPNIEIRDKHKGSVEQWNTGIMGWQPVPGATFHHSNIPNEVGAWVLECVSDFVFRASNFEGQTPLSASGDAVYHGETELAAKMLVAIVGLMSPASSIPTPRFHRVWRLETVGEEPGQWMPLFAPTMGVSGR